MVNTGNHRYPIKLTALFNIFQQPFILLLQQFIIFSDLYCIMSYYINMAQFMSLNWFLFLTKKNQSWLNVCVYSTTDDLKKYIYM